MMADTTPDRARGGRYANYPYRVTPGPGGMSTYFRSILTARRAAHKCLERTSRRNWVSIHKRTESGWQLAEVIGGPIPEWYRLHMHVRKVYERMDAEREATK